jgi:hypothetical protein
LEKELPAKERQLALELSRTRGENFLIPLNLDHRKATELNWQLSDIQFIPFHEWAAGLRQLLKLLESVNAPRPLIAQGPGFAAETFLPAPVLLSKRERLISNVYVVERVPESVFEYVSSRKVSYVESQSLRARWAYYDIDGIRFLAFCSPPDDLLQDVTFEQTATRPRDEQIVGDPNASDVATHLLRRSLTVRAIERGLAIGADGSTLYFPPSLLKNDQLWYRDPSDRKQKVHVSGERKFGVSRTRYHLGVTFYTRTDITAVPSVQVRVRLEVEDAAGTELSAKARNSRRKKITKSWWNHEWLSRQLAIMQYLANGSASIVIGERPNETLSISASPIVAEVSPSVSDRRLKRLKSKVLAMMATLDPTDDEDHESDDTDA